MDTQHNANTSTSPLRVVEIDGQCSCHSGIYRYLTFRCNLSCAHCWVGSSPRVDTSGGYIWNRGCRGGEVLA